MVIRGGVESGHWLGLTYLIEKENGALDTLILSKTGQRGSMLNMFVRDLGDNVLFAFGPSWRPSEVAIRFSSSVHELTDDYKQFYLPFNFLGNLY